MSERTVTVEYESPDEEAALAARTLRIGVRLGAAAQAFFFVAFLFAFFYLRALNTAGRWYLHHLHPSRAYGVAILICILASVAAACFAAWSLRAPSGLGWRAGTAAAIVLALAAIGLQCAQYANLGFGPGDGSFASVFVGWTGLLAVNVLAVVYLLTTMFSETVRGVGRTPELMRPAADGLALYWGVLGLIELTAFILLYLVA